MKNDRPKENEKGKYKDSLNFPLEIIVEGKDVWSDVGGGGGGSLEGYAGWTYIFNGRDDFQINLCGTHIYILKMLY